MIVVTVFVSILIQMDFHLAQNRKENYHHDHIPFNVKGKGNIVFSGHASGLGLDYNDGTEENKTEIEKCASLVVMSDNPMRRRFFIYHTKML